jgi:ACT domain-containing protein
MYMSVVHSRGERALHRCQVEVDLILDEVESKVHVDSTEFIYYFP